MSLSHLRALRTSLIGTLAFAASGCRSAHDLVPPVDPPPPPPSAPALFPLRLGAIGPDAATSVATDLSGNGYVAGTFSGTVDFDGGSGATARVANGVSDISVASYGADGAFRWAYSIGGSDIDAPYVIKVAPDGGVYVTGFVSAGATCNGRVLRNNGGRDMLLMRLTLNGSCDWAITAGGPGADEGRDLVVDSNGDVLVTGFFSGIANFNPLAGTALLNSRGGTDGFVARYGADGSFKSVTQFGGTGDDVGGAIALQIGGDPVVAGSFSSTATFGVAPVVLLASAGGFDYFVARFSPALGLRWALRGGGPGEDQVGSGGIIAGSDGKEYVVGTFSLTANIGSAVVPSHGEGDLFLVSYDDAGEWTGFAASIGGPGTDSVSAFARDADGNLYLGGTFQQTVDFDPGVGTHVVTALGSAGAGDGFVLSITKSGDLRWMNPVGAVGSGILSVNLVGGLSVSTDGSLWTVGRFFGAVDFAPGGTAAVRQALGEGDQFVVRYDQVTGAIRQ